LWCEWFDRTAERVFTALAAGDELESVAEAADWSPRYIVRLGRQRHVLWAMNYAGPYDDLPVEGYLPFVKAAGLTREYVARIRDGKVKP
jgi:hypothetical protein